MTRTMTPAPALPAVPAITSFRGRWAFLSNFHERPILFEGIWYPGNEWAFQAAKTTDTRVRKQIAELPTASSAKTVGRQIRPLRPDWELVKRAVMMQVNLAKYTQLQDLRIALGSTGSALLIEGNTWDDWYWGAVPAAGHRAPGTLPVVWRPDPDVSTWLAGHNWLGWTLMAIRDMFTREDS